jgi:hypothetical protein
MAFSESIIARLGLDNSGFNRGLVGAQQRLGQFRDFAKSVFGVGIGVGIFGALTRNALALADSILTLKDNTGLATGTIQTLQHAVVQAGGKAGEANKSLETFAVNVGKARAGSAEAARAFEMMGIALRDTNGQARSNEDILRDVADAFSKIENPADRATLATKIFGEQGLEMATALAKGNAELDKLKKHMEASGQLLTDAELRRLDAADKKVKALNERGGKGFAKFGAALSLGFSTLVTQITEAPRDYLKALFGNREAQLRLMEITERLVLAPTKRAEAEEKVAGALKEQVAALEHQRAVMQEIDQIAKKAATINDRLAGKLDDRTKFSTLKELAEADFAHGATPRALFERSEARRAMAHEAMGERMRQAGVINQAQLQFSARDRIAESLTLVQESQRNPLGSELSELTRLNKEQADLLASIDKKTLAATILVPSK